MIRSVWLLRIARVTMIRTLGLAVSAAMVAAITIGLIEGDLTGEAPQIWRLPWGRVTLVDLYLGLAIFGAWVAVRERSTTARVAWWACLALFGNLAAGIYLTVASFRSRDIRSLLLGAQDDD